MNYSAYSSEAQIEKLQSNPRFGVECGWIVFTKATNALSKRQRSR